MQTLKLRTFTRVHWLLLSLLLMGTAVLCTTQSGRQWVRHRAAALGAFLSKAQIAATIQTAPTAGASAVALQTSSGANAAVSAVPTRTGVWRFQGLAGKCLDVGGYPLGQSSPVILYDCNGTKAQNITVAPVIPDGTDVELRAHGRCLTLEDDIYQAGRAIVLTPCRDSQSQHFRLREHTTLAGTVYITTSADSELYVGVRDGNTANRTPLVLEQISNPDTASQDFTRRWTVQQVDTTPYDWAPTVATAGAYEFKGFEGKCIDIGGTTHPEHSPAFLYGCNGTLAQFFAIKSVDEHLGYYNITAFGRCLDISGSIASAGAPIELNACSGATSQRFAFDNFDRQYIYPAGTPELVIGVRATGFSVGMSAAAVGGGGGVRIEPRPPMLDLQTRAAVDYQNWQPIPVEQADLGPKAPAIRFTRQFVCDHCNGTNGKFYEPAFEVRDDAALHVTYDVFWKPLGDYYYTQQGLGGNSAGTGQILSALFHEVKETNQVYVAKARATADNGLFSESPEIIIDGRRLEKPVVWVDNIHHDELTVHWRAAGTPRLSEFDVVTSFGGGPFDEGGPTYLDLHVAAQPGTGMANLTYQQRVTGLQPNSRHGVSVTAISDFWGVAAWTDNTSVTLLPSPQDKSPVRSYLYLARDQPVRECAPYGASLGPIYDTGAIILNLNFPRPVLLLKQGQVCVTDTTAILVSGDMTADQKKAIWGTSDLRLSGLQVLNVVVEKPDPTTVFLPVVIITWRRL